MKLQKQTVRRTDTVEAYMYSGTTACTCPGCGCGGTMNQVNPFSTLYVSVQK